MFGYSLDACFLQVGAEGYLAGLGLGLAACQKGLSVGFVTAAALVHELMEARDDKQLLRFQKRLAGLKLLIIDEQGFVPLSKTGSELLFELFNEPEDQLTANRWNELLADTLALVRETNPDRFVVIGPPLWNIVWELNKLELPEDDRRIIHAIAIEIAEGIDLRMQNDRWS